MLDRMHSPHTNGLTMTTRAPVCVDFWRMPPDAPGSFTGAFSGRLAGQRMGGAATRIGNVLAIPEG